jgi:hypothetical protein
MEVADVPSKKRFASFWLLANLAATALGCGQPLPASDHATQSRGAAFRVQQGYGSGGYGQGGYGPGGYGQGGYGPGGYGPGGYGPGGYGPGYGGGDDARRRCIGGFLNPSYNRAAIAEENDRAFRLRGESVWRPTCVSSPNIAEENDVAFRQAGSAIWERK